MRFVDSVSIKKAVLSVFLLALIAFLPTHLFAQNQQNSNNSQATAGSFQAKPVKPAKPYKLSTRIHLQKNSTKGYLILKVELAQGSHIYSLTQKGNVRPTKLKIADSKQFKVMGKFIPDRIAEVTKYDPVFKQQVEKHKGVVQFFAPIELVDGVSPELLSPVITFDGQVCTAANICMPVLDFKVKGKFAGYFERAPNKTTERTANSQSSSTAPSTRVIR